MNEIHPVWGDMIGRKRSRLLKYRFLWKKQQLFLFLFCLQILIVTCAALPIQFGEPVAGTIHFAGDNDTYTFSATTGDTLVGRIRSSWQDRPVLRLYAPNNTLVTSCSDYYKCEIATTLLATGTYNLTVSDNTGDSTGSYTLFIQRPNNPTNPTSLTFGEQVSGNIVNGAELDTYTFSGSTGNSVLIQMQATGYLSQLRLYAP
ncbi:MAG: hypothetical protein MUO95_03170, partial [Methanoregula sp.]|nr:hypothetical protein [Methanoregula sp.]